MRRVAEIQGIAALEAMSQTSEFTQAAAQAACALLNVAQDLIITNPLPTIATAARDLLGFSQFQAGQAVKNVAEGDGFRLSLGQLVENLERLFEDENATSQSSSGSIPIATIRFFQMS